MGRPDYIPHYSIEDYLQWEGDWELWNGIPVAMSPPPNFRHQRIGSRILMQIQGQLDSDSCERACEAVYEVDWHVDDNTVVCPDVLVVCEEPEGKFVEEAPALIAEVLSPSTREKDLTAKRYLYARAGVGYYLIFDPEDSTAQFLELDGETYRQIETGEEITLEDGCRVRVDVAAVFA